MTFPWTSFYLETRRDRFVGHEPDPSTRQASSVRRAIARQEDQHIVIGLELRPEEMARYLEIKEIQMMVFDQADEDPPHSPYSA
ncbi:MAG TPA: hypothetical protein VHY91_21565 [Pirellulales bacterium]|jgi:hypothetical protein|nr:hypothetical protein [Pirellulales bacterium]